MHIHLSCHSLVIKSLDVRVVDRGALRPVVVVFHLHFDLADFKLWWNNQTRAVGSTIVLCAECYSR